MLRSGYVTTTSSMGGTATSIEINLAMAYIKAPAARYLETAIWQSLEHDCP